MDYKRLLLAGALLLQPIDSAKEESTITFQDNLYDTLTGEVVNEESKPAYYHFEISKELLQQIDTMCLDKDCPVVFSRSWADVRNTPLVMKGTRRHIGEYLGYDQYDYILKTYNNDTIPDSLKTYNDLRINQFENINFPLIYDELEKVAPHTLEGLLKDEKFTEYRDTVHMNDTLMVNLDVNGKRSFLYYETGQLILATYTTIGGGESTPRGFFHIDYKVDYKKSKKYNNAAMPYALHVTENVFIHQGEVSHTTHSHGCTRLPGLYAEVLFYLITTPKLGMVYEAERNELDSTQMQLYDSLAKGSPKILIVD